MSTLKSNWVDGDQYTPAAANAVANTFPLSGTYAALPAAGYGGRVYYCTDVGLVLRDNGTSWDIVYGGPKSYFVQPPGTGWTTVNLGSATVAADKGGRLFTLPTVSGEQFSLEYLTLSPTSGYTAEAYLETVYPSTSFVKIGLVLYDSASGKFIWFGPGYNSTTYGGISLAIEKMTNATTYSAGYSYATLGPSGIRAMPNWIRIRDDGTTRYFEYSFNGVDWAALYSVGRTDFITPTSIGWGGENRSSITSTARLRSFNITTP